MCGTPIQALFALVAHNIDFPHDAIAYPHPLPLSLRERGWSEGNHLANKFVPGYAGVGIVALYEFEVGGADSSLTDLDQGFVRFAWLVDFA